MSPGRAAAAAAARILRLDAAGLRPAAGGAWRIGDAAFVKVLPLEAAPRLAAEAEGLAALGTALRVPEVLGRGETQGRAWLALEWLALRRPGDAEAARFGHALAALHRRTAPAFGWDRDNWIGPSPQANGWLADWPEFFARRRLAPQFAAAAQRGAAALAADGKRLCAQLPRLLAGHRPPPARIHGDLWGGNWGALPDATPVAFDPAVHYADRECDLAMCELFGGFPASFHAAYREAWPLPDGYAARRDLYQLYHLLNHFNLFGSAYLDSAHRIIRRLLAFR